MAVFTIISSSQAPSEFPSMVLSDAPTMVPTSQTPTMIPTALAAEGLPIYDYVMTPSAFVSAVCSGLVIYHIVASRRKTSASRPHRGAGSQKAAATFHRLLLGLCVYDVLSSATMLFEPYTTQVDIIGHWTCSASGFFKVLGFSCASIYNAGLSTFSFLIVCRNWKDEALSTYFEPLMHVIIAALTLFLGTGIFFEVYNPSTTAGCWAGAYPQGCNEEDSLEECQRGDPWGPIVELMASGGLIIVMITLVVTHSAIFCTVRSQERRLHRYDFKNSASTETTQASRRSNSQWRTSGSQAMNSSQQGEVRRKDSKLRKVASQSMVYCLGFLGAYMVALVHTLVTGGVQHYDAVWYPPVRILQEILFPCQGIINFITYMRPKYLQWRRALLNSNTEADSSRWKAIKMTLSAADFSSYRQSILQSRRSRACSVPASVPVECSQSIHIADKDFTSASFALPSPEDSGAHDNKVMESWSNENQSDWRSARIHVTDALGPPRPMEEDHGSNEEEQLLKCSLDVPINAEGSMHSLQLLEEVPLIEDDHTFGSSPHDKEPIRQSNRSKTIDPNESSSSCISPDIQINCV